MARPPRKRIISMVPEYSLFQSDGITVEETLNLSLDEFETIRLLDKEHKTQEECAKEMGVSRALVASIYQKAREKIALALIDGRALSIGGGPCEIKCEYNYSFLEKPRNKGDKEMRIAVTYDNGDIFQHFGRTEQFKIYDVEDKKVVSSSVVGTNGQGHGALAGVLSSLGADILICGGIGGGAQMALSEMGIKLLGGVSGKADDAVESFLNGTLEASSAPNCDHHHHHEGEEHNCSHGGCGNHCHH